MTKDTATVVSETALENPKNHNLVENWSCPGLKYEKKNAIDENGNQVDGIYNVWITLDNEKQFNSYDTEMVKGMILGFREASNSRDVNAVVLTGTGHKAFCTGGNTKEYAEYYSGNDQEYRQYMRLFNDMVSTMLVCDKPVICRVNGMRIGGGQEMGMACDFSIAQDMANFGQAGPKHGSAAIGGATDFLPPLIGVEQAMVSAVLCRPLSAHKAARLGIITDTVPALKVDGKFIPNPYVVTEAVTDDYGRLIHGEFKEGEEKAKAREIVASGEMDLSLLDAKVEELCTAVLLTFPECTTKSLEQLRKPKLEVWNLRKEDARSWLGYNMMAEARAGFRAFNEGNKEIGREIDFIALRKARAAGAPWSDELIESLMPRAED
ncbi:MAG: 6-oxocyclohex-1-ene-1-carbonyl-CoA hydratase [Rhodospirillales bacterium]|jgi:6-oxo-cyclohex-1-ene-carbonyl-CoA hydrolase|nr:6-oxocyclohex-1-ene-1-carbonyl-CoA hydratase [Rhodospirillaceae bacterium]MDP6429162.1 6-oxocyclohex-1-ene-1-carbonyl-CoA hydratase [Rhodospirillales bacterium]MDP6643340.1 6-oxocyclohex-1-ene-1-carbonyl-CoA hydratase [Rhodospirillales bacterium]MDP6840048.1 6-oxocyclohex-1-ene-1-carbonyl-CoA hydratase [Rhodospirillales bacterium]|tara:strand:- start:1875 stop:3011 length:1137 start_codon:yes stop_codon:yes gene_type:complete